MTVLSETSKSLNIMFVIPALKSGGVERCTVDIANYVQSHGHHAIVVSNGGPMEKELIAGVKHIKSPVHKKGSGGISRTQKYLERIIIAENIDLVEAGSRAPAWGAFRACAKLKIPFITTWHGTYKPGLWNMKKNYNSVMAFGDLVITPSNFIKEFIRAGYSKYVEDFDRIIPVHRWVNSEKYNAGKVDPRNLDLLRSKLKLPADKKVVLFPGRITRWKGYPLFVEAIARLKHRDDFIALVVGAPQSPKYLKELQTLIAQNELENLIKITDDNGDMVSMYALGYLMVSAATTPEAFGMMAIEAQAMGLPVVATAHGGALESVIDGETGFLVKPDNATDMALSIERLLELSSSEYSQMAVACIKNAKLNFELKYRGQDILNIYELVYENREAIIASREENSTSEINEEIENDEKIE